MNTVDYLSGLKDTKVIIYINTTDEEQTSSYIGIIKYVLEDGSIVLARSEKFNEVVIMHSSINAVRQWTEK